MARFLAMLLPERSNFGLNELLGGRSVNLEPPIDLALCNNKCPIRSNSHLFRMIVKAKDGITVIKDLEVSAGRNATLSDGSLFREINDVLAIHDDHWLTRN